MLDAVPKNAEIIVESADSAVIMLFDSLLGSNIHAENVVNGQPMGIVKVSYEDQSDFLLLTQPAKKSIKVFGNDYRGIEAVDNQRKSPEKIYDNPDFITNIPMAGLCSTYYLRAATW